MLGAVSPLRLIMTGLSAIFGYEVIASIFLMGIIYIVVHFKKLAMLTGIAIGGIIAIDVLLLEKFLGRQ